MQVSRRVNGHRRLLAAGVGCVIACASAGAAIAAPGEAGRVPVDNSGVTDVGPGVLCSFGVTISTVTSKEYMVRRSTAPDGTTTDRITGRLVQRVTNTDTGKSQDFNVS